MWGKRASTCVGRGLLTPTHMECLCWEGEFAFFSLALSFAVLAASLAMLPSTRVTTQVEAVAAGDVAGEGQMLQRA